MKIIAFHSVLIIVLICFFAILGRAQVPFQCRGQNYISIANFTSTRIYDVKIDNGSVDFTPLANTTNVSLNAIGYRSKDNLIYGIDPSDRVLYKVDSNGQAFYAGDIDDLNGSYYAGAISPDGRFLTLLHSSNRHLALIDLDTQDLDLTIINLTRDNGQTITSSATDIAYEPLTGDIYGFDSSNRRLIRIDITTATLYQDEFPQTSVVSRIGACFFDPFGTFYGYGSSPSSNGSTELFQTDISTGIFTRIGTGPVASEKDGCSCPYTISLQKSVYPEVIFQCTEAKYKFYIANGSGEILNGIDLLDDLPTGLTIQEINRNPFGGSVSGIGSNQLAINNMSVPIGRDSIVITVIADPFTEGFYKNQARLEDLPERLGETVFSDNPKTLIVGDSTILEVVPLFNDIENKNFFECDLDSILINAGTYGVTYLWQDGSQDSLYLISDPGVYWVEISTGCETVRDTITANEPDIPIQVNAGVDSVVLLGNSYELYADINIPFAESYHWEESADNTLSCYDCADPTTLTYFNNTYSVTVTDKFGCTDSDEISLRVDKDFTVIHPNIFSPNGDRINDAFYITSKALGTQNYLKIFDRWGNLVHNGVGGFTNDPTNGWNGKYKGQYVNAGVFAFISEVEFLDGHKELISGDLTVVR